MDLLYNCGEEPTLCDTSRGKPDQRVWPELEGKKVSSQS